MPQLLLNELEKLWTSRIFVSQCILKVKSQNGLSGSLRLGVPLSFWDCRRFATNHDIVDLPNLVLPQNLVGASEFLYSLLVQICSGKALLIVRLCGDGNGILAWRKLLNAYEPRQAMRFTAMLSSLFTPHWMEGFDFSSQWMQ